MIYTERELKIRDFKWRGTHPTEKYTARAWNYTKYALLRTSDYVKSAISTTVYMKTVGKEKRVEELKM